LISIKLVGLKELQAQLVNLGAELGVKTLARAARKAFQPVLDDARNLVPVDTGELRDSLKLSSKRPRSGDTVVVVGLRVGAGRGDGTKVPPARRWHWIELGTAKLPAHPFARPALDRNADRVLELLKEELVKGIQRAVRKQARAAAKADAG
jgi:HK97 gp10 family phage protein